MRNSAIIQVRDGGGLYQSGGIGERGEECLTGYILKVETVDFLNTVALMCQTKKKGIQSDPESFGLNHWQRKGVGGTAGGKVRSAGWDRLSLGCCWISKRRD